jgi:hypothetical protein
MLTPQLARCTVPGFPNEPARGTRGGLGKAAITSVFIVISLPSRPNRRNMAGRGFMAMTRGHRREPERI